MLNLADQLPLPLCLCPPGTFQIGSRDGREDELRGPEITFAKGFWLGRTLVTVGQFQQFLVATTTPKPAWLDEQQSDRPLALDGTWRRNARLGASLHQPMTCVTHLGAEAYCAWLSATYSMTVNLPSEAQWEYAARSQSETPFFWGEDYDPEACHADAHNVPGRAQHPVDVGLYPPNAWDLYDMIGNVWEWCADRYHRNHTDLDPSGLPRMKASSYDRVIRGASWGSAPIDCRSSSRQKAPRKHGFPFVGFRIAVGGE